MAAWEFQSLQNIAEKHNWHKFISMQNYYNLLYREEEREMIPYCQDTGVGIIPWSPLARGKLPPSLLPDFQADFLKVC
jgi:aryl-alcohol dehydrogenase-like predicted oxidoreductase